MAERVPIASTIDRTRLFETLSESLCCTYYFQIDISSKVCKIFASNKLSDVKIHFSKTLGLYERSPHPGENFYLLYELFYFPVKGRGQAIRYMLLDNNVEYTETNVLVPTPETWAEKYKPKMPFGQCPLLKDGDFEIAQSTAILRYIGRKCGANPDDAKDAARADMMDGHTEDIRGAYTKMIYQNYEAGKEDHIKAACEKLGFAENVLKAWGNDYINGKICFADYNLFDLLDIHEVLSPGILDKFPTLKAYHARMAARPAIQKLRDTEQCKNMPINGNGKQ